MESTEMDAKSEQFSELTEEVQQPFQLTADVDSFGDELMTKLEDGEVVEENPRQLKVFYALHSSWVKVAIRIVIWMLLVMKLFLLPRDHHFVISFSC